MSSQSALDETSVGDGPPATESEPQPNDAAALAPTNDWPPPG